MSLANITSTRTPKPPKVLVYGSIKVGKSTFAAGAPSPIFIRTEDGLDAIDVPAFPLASSWADVLDAVGALAEEEHEFKTVVLDSADWAEPLCWAAVSRAGGVESIEEYGKGYGKGYVEAGKYWRDLLDGLDWLRNHRQMGVIIICHDEVRRVEPPDGDVYDCAGLKLHKRASALVAEWADVIGYARIKHAIKVEDLEFKKKHKRAVGMGARLLTVGQNPAYLSGNRYGLPDDLDLSWDAFEAALAATRRTA